VNQRRSAAAVANPVAEPPGAADIRAGDGDAPGGAADHKREALEVLASLGAPADVVRDIYQRATRAHRRYRSAGVLSGGTRRELTSARGSGKLWRLPEELPLNAWTL